MISALLINTMDKLPKIPLEYLTIKMNTIHELMLLMIPKNRKQELLSEVNMFKIIGTEKSSGKNWQTNFNMIMSQPKEKNQACSSNFILTIIR